MMTSTVLARLSIAIACCSAYLITPEVMAQTQAVVLATVREVMDMTTGLQFSENYANPKAEVWDFTAAGNPIPPFAGGGFNAGLRDLARFGELIRNNGPRLQQPLDG